MDKYIDRLPIIGGLIEQTKSKKGVAFILTLVILFGGAALHVENEILLTAATSAWIYIGGQSYVDARQTVAEIRTGVLDGIQDVVDTERNKA